MALPSRKTSRVKSIVTFDGELEEAFSPQSVTLTLEDEIDISRGDMIVRPGNVPRVEQKFEATIVWMSEEPMVPGQIVLVQADDQAHARHDQHAPLSDRRQHAAPQGRPDAQAQRNRPLHDHAQSADLLRRLPPQSRDRRVHRHRPRDQRHRRCRHDSRPQHGRGAATTTGTMRPPPPACTASEATSPPTSARPASAKSRSRCSSPA